MNGKMSKASLLDVGMTSYMARK